jgi:hypothetical protein
MTRLNKIARIIAKNFSIPLLSVGMVAAMATPSHAWLRGKCLIYIVIDYTKPYSVIRAILDPENVESFNYNASFNPAELALDEIVYEGSYTQTTPPDLSQLSLGLIQGIAGSTSTPPSGNADLFSLIFTPLVANPQSNISFFAGPQGFVVTRDSDTGETTTLGPDECPICESPPVPEPLTLFGSALGLGFGAILKKEYSRKQKKAKTLEKLKA